jgi:hypothetical protein
MVQYSKGDDYLKKVFADDLPKHKYGVNKDKIDWNNSIGCKIKFIYDDIEGEMKITDYASENKLLKIKYDNKYFEIKATNITQCKIGKIIGKKTSEFKIEIGKNFKDSKRDITIIDRKHEVKNIGETSRLNEKLYKIHCNICDFDGTEYYDNNGKHHKDYWIKERAIITSENGCPCCANQIVVKNINSIVVKARWMISYFQGGYNEAKKYSCHSHKKIHPICPNCGRIKSTSITIDNIYKNHSIGCSCSDNISYPEKYVFSIFEQIGIDFKTQLSKTTFNWITNDKRYDFYFKINNEDYIIETHGKQHYEKCGWSTLQDIQNNDEFKKQLALSNGIKEENYIVIDCRYSESDWIKNSILQNKKINKIFNLSRIDWLKAEKFAYNSRIKETCELKRDNPKMTNVEIGEKMKLVPKTVAIFLKRGKKLGW